MQRGFEFFFSVPICFVDRRFNNADKLMKVTSAVDDFERHFHLSAEETVNRQNTRWIGSKLVCLWKAPVLPDKTLSLSDL